MLKLKLQYFGHLMRRVDSLEKILMLGGIGGRRRRGRQRMRWLDRISSLTRWTWVWVNSRSWWWTGRPGVLWFMGSQRDWHDWVTELNWTEALTYQWYYLFSLETKYPIKSSIYKMKYLNEWPQTWLSVIWFHIFIEYFSNSMFKITCDLYHKLLFQSSSGHD